MLEDVRLEDKDNISNVVDDSKKSNKKCRLKLTNNVLAEEETQFDLYFEGRKDKTMKQELVDGKYEYKYL